MDTPQAEYEELAPQVKTLLTQQRYITIALGYILHPLIIQSLGQDSSPVDRKRVAIVSDSLTASTNPSAGISIGQRATLPRQEELRVDPSLQISWEEVPSETVSSTTELEPRLVGYFDAVAVNPIHTSIEKEDWERTMQNIVDIVKPGGWVQWVDWDPITARIAGSKPGTPDAANLRDLFRTYTDGLQARNVGSTYRISNGLKSRGLVECDSDLYPVAPDVEFTCVVADRAVDYLKRTGQLSPEEVGAIEEKIGDEIQTSGPLVWYDLWCHVARKPRMPKSTKE